MSRDTPTDLESAVAALWDIADSLKKTKEHLELYFFGAKTVHTTDGETTITYTITTDGEVD